MSEKFDKLTKEIVGSAISEVVAALRERFPGDPIKAEALIDLMRIAQSLRVTALLAQLSEGRPELRDAVLNEETFHKLGESMVAALDLIFVSVTIEDLEEDEIQEALGFVGGLLARLEEGMRESLTKTMADADLRQELRDRGDALLKKLKVQP